MRPKIYRLYIWAPSHSDFRRRGRCIGRYPFYYMLLRDAKRRASAAGYPKSRWMDLFDWNV